MGNHQIKLKKETNRKIKSQKIKGILQSTIQNQSTYSRWNAARKNIKLYSIAI